MLAAPLNSNGGSKEDGRSNPLYSPRSILSKHRANESPSNRVNSNPSE